MRAQHQQGAASAAPIDALARDFLAIGGRIMVSPEGSVVTAISPGTILGRDVSRPERRRRRGCLRAFVQVEQRNGATLALLVASNGSARPNGWQVWEAAR